LHLFATIGWRRLVPLGIAGSAVGLGSTHIAQLANVPASECHEIACLLADAAVVVNKPDGEPNRPTRATLTLAEQLVANGDWGGRGLQQRNGPTWRGVVLSASPDASQPPPARDCLGRAASMPFTLELPLSRQAWGHAVVGKARGAPARRLLQACSRQAGMAFKHYIQFLVANHQKLALMATADQADFRDELAKREPQLRNSPLVTGFARLYAGGAMAITAGVLPWQRDKLLAALIACLEVAQAHASRNGVSLGTLRQLLHEQLRQIGAPKGRCGPGQAPGFCQLDGTARVYTIHGKAFRSWFADRRQRVAVLRWLHEAGHLRMGERQYRPSSTSTEWAERAVRWPDGVVHRSYVFRDPFTLVSAAHLVQKSTEKTPR
jgi:hypothetical protein